MRPTVMARRRWAQANLTLSSPDWFPIDTERVHGPCNIVIRLESHAPAEEEAPDQAAAPAAE